MYEVIKKADKFGLNKVFANSRDFVNVIEELRTQVKVKLNFRLVKQTLNKIGYYKTSELRNLTQAAQS